jgi:hypothetical protein
MSRFEVLLEKYQEGSVSSEEGEELSRLLREDEGRARTFFDEVLLDVDLFESYAGIARVQAVPRRSRRWHAPQLTLAWAVAVFVLIGLVALLFNGGSNPPAPAPVPPPAVPKKVELPPEPKPKIRREKEEHEERDHEDHDRGSRRSEIEREFQKGLREVERKRAEGNLKEANEKQREIERERDKKLRSLDQRDGDR